MQEGPVHDVQWSPSGDYFITVAGFMPAKSTVFTEACKPFYDLGSGGHNLVRWNPQVGHHRIQACCVMPTEFLILPLLASHIWPLMLLKQRYDKFREGLWQ